MTVQDVDPRSFIDKTRIYLVPWGAEKTGKTTLALTFPAPIWFFNFNYGLEGIIDPFVDKIYKLTNFELTPLSGPQDHIDAYEFFRKKYFEAITYCARERGTVVVDNGTQLYDTVKAATLETVRREKYSNKENVKFLAWDYGDANTFMHAVSMAPLQVKGVNAVLIHAAKPLWVGGESTGLLTIDSWHGVPGAGQVIAQTKREGNLYQCVINSSRLNGATQGQTVLSDFDMLAAVSGVVRP